MKVIEKEELRKLMLGPLRGNVGNLTARVINGKIILSRRPLKYNVSNSAAAIKGRKIFAVAGSIAHKVVTLPMLCNCWKRTLKKGLSVQNYVTQLNYKRSPVDRPAISNIITPPDGFPLNMISTAAGENMLNVSIGPIERSVPLSGNEKGYILNGLLCYYNPVNPKDKLYTITTIEHPFEINNVSQPVFLEISLNDEQKNISARYGNAIIYLALVVLDGDGCVLGYSATFAQES